MKRINILLALLVLVVFTQCKKDKDDTDKGLGTIDDYVSKLNKNDRINYLVFGDFGAANTASDSVFRSINTLVDKVDIESFMTLGDNIYDVGVQSTSDPKFQMWADSFYVDEIGKVWNLTLGNHDRDGLYQPQIDYTALHQYWNMPARFYAIEDSVQGSPRALFLMLDTEPLHLNNVSSAYSRWQLGWADSVLEASEASFKILCGHHPLYSGGDHGSDPVMQNHLDTLLENSGVHLYCAGHDHDMQYLSIDGKNCQHIVSGATAYLRPGAPIAGTEFQINDFGYVLLSVKNDEMELYYLNRAHEVIFLRKIKK